MTAHPQARVDAVGAEPAVASVERTLTRFFNEAISRADAYGDIYRELWSTLRSASAGGKRFRPELLLGVYRHLGGRDESIACEVAAAVELLHTAFVIHDDVIDHDDVRRGRRNVSGTFVDRGRAAGAAGERARTLADAAGILAGDLALSGALRLVATSAADPDVRSDLMGLFDHAIYVSAAGELLDVYHAIDPSRVQFSDVVAIAAQKTAGYSFELPMQVGGLLAGAGRPAIELLGQVGRCLGIAYQLLDDVDGVFGDEAVTGKSVLTDLREGKITPLIAHARGTDSWPAIEQYLGDPDLTHEHVARVRAALDASGSRGFVEQLARDHLASARRLAGDSHLPQPLMDWLESVTSTFAPRR